MVIPFRFPYTSPPPPRSYLPAPSLPFPSLRPPPRGFPSPLQYRKQFFRQKTGIAQGSILSSLLCSIHFARMDNQIFSELPITGSQNGEKIGVLMRLIDDYLYITNDLPSAQRFLHLMKSDPFHFGFSVNPDKTQANFVSGGTSPPFPPPFLPFHFFSLSSSFFFLLLQAINTLL